MAKLFPNWKTASKHISQLKLPEEPLATYFERKAHGSTYYFASAQMRMKNAGGIVHELQEGMQRLNTRLCTIFGFLFGEKLPTANEFLRKGKKTIPSKFITLWFVFPSKRDPKIVQSRVNSEK